MFCPIYRKMCEREINKSKDELIEAQINRDEKLIQKIEKHLLTRYLMIDDHEGNHEESKHICERYERLFKK